MSNQINDEHNRVLDQYQAQLEQAATTIALELKALKENRALQYRHAIRHSVLLLADTINETEAKLKVFDNLIWEPRS